MTVSQIILYAIFALVILLYIRRLILRTRMKEYYPKQVAELISHPSILLLDVRTNKERMDSYIKGSLHIPLSELSEKIITLEQYRNKEIICYCYSGSRSLVAAAILQKHGFKTANMKGGILKWKY